MIQITETRLKELEKREAKLLALEAGGVDNWEWYSESLKDWFKENEVDELVQEFISEFNDNYFEFTEVDFPAGMDAGASVNFIADWEPFFAKMFHKLLNEYDSLDKD